MDLLDELHLCIKAINSLKTTYLELLLKEQFESTSSFSLLTGYNIAYSSCQSLLMDLAGKYRKKE